MPPPSRLFQGDEELGKKDDDHKPGKKSMAWSPRVQPHLQKRSAKRLTIGAFVLLAFYLFFKNMPTDLQQPRTRPHYQRGSSPTKTIQTKPSAPSPVIDQERASQPVSSARPQAPVYDYGGPIKFYKLAATLHAASDTMGSQSVNRNVLFAAASLKSAAILLPFACEMAGRERNYVHFALMGRDDISMDLLRTVNGVTKECDVMFHDARPDFSPISSDFRMKVSVSAGFSHINTYVNPQATIIDSSGDEDGFFVKGLKGRAQILGRTIIELPENAEESMLWLTRLDSASLSAWDKARVDMLIHAPPTSSGSLIRLLNSLKQADFYSSAPPRLTIDLPHDVDEPTRRYLETFKWPPKTDSKTGSLLSLHRRIPQRGLTPEENSIRFLETFWPADPFSSHVLVLSPQTELSPLFFHYLKYSILEYKYSANKYDGHENVLGISLELPEVFLDDKTKFKPPLNNNSHSEESPVVTSFLWQSPNSNAALYFGEKWVELHDFVSHLLSSQHLLPTPATLNKKLISKSYPSWLEHILKLARTRGYTMLYPNFQNTEALATMHTELYQAPEEYAEELEPEDSGSILTADPARQLRILQKQKETTLARKSLLSILPFEGTLPQLLDVPIISFDGEQTDNIKLSNEALEYSKVFRREIGGCEDEAEVKSQVRLKSEDLFCLNEGSS